MVLRSLLSIFTIATLGAAVAAGPARAAFDREAAEFIGDLGNMSAAITETDGTSPARIDKLYGFIDRVVDVPTIARFTLGRYWRRADEQQRVEFVALFRDHIAYSIADRITYLTGAGITIQKVVPVKASKAKDVLVMSRIKLRGGQALGVVWRCRKTATGPKLVDVIVDGISMAVVQREEFASVMSSTNGDIDGFITALREKTHAAGNMVAERQD